MDLRPAYSRRRIRFESSPLTHEEYKAQVHRVARNKHMKYVADVVSGLVMAPPEGIYINEQSLMMRL